MKFRGEKRELSEEDIVALECAVLAYGLALENSIHSVPLVFKVSRFYDDRLLAVVIEKCISITENHSLMVYS